MVEVSAEQLLASIGGGDERALAELYDRFGGVAYGLARRVARDTALAEEAVQDAFLSVWRSASQFDCERGSARGWVLTLVHRRAVDLVEPAARRSSLEVPTPEPPDQGGASTAEAAEVLAERRRVCTALAALPPAQRRALELAYYGGYSQTEIATHLGVPVGTIKSRIFVGLSTLRDLLSESQPPESLRDEETLASFADAIGAYELDGRNGSTRHQSA